ncbi:MAG TPA: ABC transporter permease [Gaiellales bacterium]|nr:ABC transporter permease [Gaiellales bacterium]
MNAVAARLSARVPTGARAIGLIGVAFGFLAVWLALPPFEVRAQGAPVALAVIGLGCGAWALQGREWRAGGWAVGVAIVAVLIAAWAQGRSTTTLAAIVNAGLLASTLQYATPLGWAAIGGVISERAGVVNIGLEGMMLNGAFFGIWAAAWSGTWVVGLLVAIAAGAVLAAVHAIFTIHLRADQIVIGTAINFLALGVTGYMFIDVYGDQGTPANVSMVPQVSIPGIRSLPGVLGVFGSLNLMIWLLFAAIVLIHVVLFRTPIGLRIRSVGEHPRAADTVGISVYGTRYAAVILSGMLAALGGAYLSIGFVGSFDQNMTAGRGFIALAAMIFGKWRPYGAFGACLLFGFASGLADRLQQSADVSVNLLSTLPYVLTLIALVGLIGRSRPPAADGRPYVKE